MSAQSAYEADRWMDSDEIQPTRSPWRGLSGLRGLRDAPGKVLTFARTTPGQLIIVTTVVIAAILAAGLSMGFTSSQRQEELDNLATRTEPLSNAAQELFNNLSVADSMATTGFLQQYNSTSTTDRTFDQALQRASYALIRASTGIPDIESEDMALVLHIQERLPTYVQLTAEAQTNDRLLNPVGASYLAQASHLMQSDLLPAAQTLYERTAQEVTAQQASLTRPAWVPLSGLLAAVIILVIAQFWLAAQTNRRINVGWLVATVLMTLALGLASVTNVYVWHLGTASTTASMTPLQTLTQARITIQQARTVEALGLVQREYGVDRQTMFQDSISRIDSDLEHLRDSVAQPERIDAARELVRQWDQSHSRMVFEIQRGDYAGAVRTALKLEESSADRVSHFQELDDNLQAMIRDTRDRMREVLIDGRTIATRNAVLVLLLTIGATIAALAGLRPRFQEYL